MTIADQVTARIAAIDADITRVKQHAIDEVTRLQALRAPLVTALQKLQADPALGTLLQQLLDQGAL